jgi:16S rRNA (uracil1498-N3)-methyltransferase
MESFYCPPQAISNETVNFAGEEAHHIAKVLRHKIGDRILAVDGQGMEYEVKITLSTPTLVQGMIEKKRRKPKEPLTQITLAQTIPRGTRMEFCVEKATEIGINGIIPIVSQRSVVQPMEESKKVDRWRRVARAAMKQAGRAILPEIKDVQSFEQAVKSIPEFDISLIAWEKEGKKGVKEVIDENPNSELRNPQSLSALLFVGPEGGFTEAEVVFAKEKGAFPVSLGLRRLRSETAGILLTSLLLHELGDL